jgi:GAF domain-containing protein
MTPPPVPQPIIEEEEEEEPETLAERLFDLSFDIAEAAPGEAARLSLELIQEYVPCEAASIVRGTINDIALTFLAASGPVGGEIIGKRVPFGKGLIGLCFDMGLTVQINDVEHEKRHYSAMDQKTGFHTRSALCVPIRDTGGSYGVIQLLNPPSNFTEWHIECVETVAGTLAGPLRGS